MENDKNDMSIIDDIIDKWSVCWVGKLVFTKVLCYECVVAVRWD